MAVNIEDYVPVVKHHGLNTEKPANLAGGVNVTGATSSASNYTALSGTATTAGGATTPALRMGTAGLGVYFGSGLPTISAAQGSLYLRTDGSSTSTRLYVNTNGTTGWTNVTTAA
jgi:hypothetical protein